MLIRLANYIYHSLRTPTARRLGFLDGGLGIERRYRQHQKAWQPHLAQCLAAQSAWCKAIKARVSPNTPRSIAILGAGRLYDLNISALMSAFSELHLFDADPSAISSWRKLRKQHGSKIIIHEHIGDISSMLVSWVSDLHKKLHKLSHEKLTLAASWDKALSIIREIPLAHCDPQTGELPPSTFCQDNSFDAILSLNLLSQLPLPWQDCISHALEKIFPPNWIKEHEAQWLTAYLSGAELLIRQHLRDITSPQVSDTLLITDIEYQTEHERTSEHIAALGHVVLDSTTIGSLCPNATLTNESQWIWKIKPATRAEPHALTHHVAAFALKANEGIARSKSTAALEK